jgi:CheY-like chemotaxis protein
MRSWRCARTAQRTAADAVGHQNQRKTASFLRNGDGKVLAKAPVDIWKELAVPESQVTSVLTFVKTYATRMKRPPTAPLSVLIVDDEESVRKYVERVLREAGYKTALASDGPEAMLVAASLESFDLLLTDLMMPQMTGDELARRLRQSTPSLKVLYLTGFSDRLFTEKVTLWADEAFLEKPCSVKGLLQAVSLLAFGRCEASLDVSS